MTLELADRLRFLHFTLSMSDKCLRLVSHDWWRQEVTTKGRMTFRLQLNIQI